jgi:hypothetical protein
MKRILSLAAATIAVCLITPAADAQQSNLNLRFRVPFQFSVDGKSFAAGEYEVTQQASLLLNVYNRADHTSAFESVRPAQSRKEGNGRVRLVFHRFGDQYFLASVSSGQWESTYDFKISKEEERLAYESPRKPVITVSVAPSGAVQIAASSQK